MIQVNQMYSPWFLILGKLGRKNPVDHFREPETMSLELPAMDAATCTQADHELVRQSELEAGCFFSMRQNGGVFSVTICNSLYLLKSFCGVSRVDRGCTGPSSSHGPSRGDRNEHHTMGDAFWVHHLSWPQGARKGMQTTDNIPDFLYHPVPRSRVVSQHSLQKHHETPTEIHQTIS